MDCPAALPLLALVLRELYERRRGEVITLADYLYLGDTTSGLNPIQSSLRNTVERCFEPLAPTPEEFQALHEAFVPHLVKIDLESDTPMRRVARVSELPPKATRLVSALVEARVLMASATGDGTGATVEVTPKHCSGVGPNSSAGSTKNENSWSISRG